MKYLSEKTIRENITGLERFAEKSKRNAEKQIHNGYSNKAIEEIKMFDRYVAQIQLLDDLLAEHTEELNPNYLKQCKDCEEFVSNETTPKCCTCSQQVRCNTDYTKSVYCPNYGFCKKYEKFVDEYTECM